MYVGRRLLRRVRILLLAAVLAGGVLIAHPQTRLQQTLAGRDPFGDGIRHFGSQLQRGLEQHFFLPSNVQRVTRTRD